jgi:hypothetical protein
VKSDPQRDGNNGFSGVSLPDKAGTASFSQTNLRNISGFYDSANALAI